MSLFSTKQSDSMREESYHAAGRNSAGTVIAHGVRVEGDFSSQGDVVIEGEVRGNVNIAGQLTVGTEAKLQADVSAQSALIAGKIEGNLNVKSHLDLKSTAQVVGDLTCETAAVESGATLNGKVLIGAKASVAVSGKAGKATE